VTPDPSAAMTEPSEFSVVLCTAPQDRAEDLADKLLEARLIACANLVGPVVSRYVWQGRVERAEECLMVLKTRATLVPELTARLAEWHPYDVPEVLEVPVQSGLAAYLAWLDASCRPARD
jgi:periplasmic divalent cation tolerance protein